MRIIQPGKGELLRRMMMEMIGRGIGLMEMDWLRKRLPQIETKGKEISIVSLLCKYTVVYTKIAKVLIMQEDVLFYRYSQKSPSDPNRRQCHFNRNPKGS